MAKYNNKVKLITYQSDPYFLLYIYMISLHHTIEWHIYLCQDFAMCYLFHLYHTYLSI